MLDIPSAPWNEPANSSQRENGSVSAMYRFEGENWPTITVNRSVDKHLLFYILHTFLHCGVDGKVVEMKGDCSG